VIKLARAAVLFFAILTILSFAGPFSATLDLLSQWRIQILAIGMLICVPAALVGTRRLAIAAISLLLLNAWPIGQHAERAAPLLADGFSTDMNLSLLSANLQLGAAEPEALDRLLESTPDLAVFTEVSDEDLQRLQALLPDHHFEQSGMPGSLWAVVIASRHPINVLYTDYPTPAGQFIVTIAEVCPEDCLRVAALHAAHPEGLLGAPVQAIQFHMIADWVAGNGPIDFLIGDLNATPWSHTFGVLTAPDGGNFFDTAPWQTAFGTWPAVYMGLGIRIDHILVSETWGVSHYEIGSDIGSDHLPVMASVARIAAD